jgi:outer membrane protein W
MKKYIILFVFLLGLQTIFAQSDKSAGLRFTGLVTHPNQNGLAGGKLDFFFKKSLGSKLSLATGGGYKWQNQRENLLFEEELIKTKSLIIPIGLQYHVFKSSYAGAGLEFDLLMSANRNNEINGKDTSVKNKFNGFNSTAYVLVGYEIKKMLNVELSWHFGLAPKLIYPDAFGKTKSNRYFGISIGWFFLHEK